MYEPRIKGYRIKKNQLLHENKRESRLRKILNRIFGISNIYEEVAFDWCYNPETTALLRFDFAIVLPDRIFLVEFNGEQHYKFVKFYHKNRANYKKQLERDKIKVKSCRKKGIALVVVPYYMAIEENNIWTLIKRKANPKSKRRKRGHHKKGH
jgi:hypothetical protein